jgi:ABC-type Fe3+-siderophore transport system permease subunit
VSRSRWIWAWSVCALLLGAITVSVFWGLGSEPLDRQILLELRIPRVLLAVGVGAALGVAGLIFQTVFLNPLCEPYVLGTSSGAALGAVLASSWGGSWILGGVVLASAAGSALFSLLLISVSRLRRLDRAQILLFGVMLSFVGSSAVSVWMAISDPQGIQAAISWLLGDLSRADKLGSSVILILSLIVAQILWRSSRELDAQLLGERVAYSLGIDVTRLRNRSMIWASLLVGLAVSTAGMIGFVGLLVPHVVRRQLQGGHRVWIPAAAICGALVMVMSDFFARTLLNPIEIPAGVITVLVGAPALGWLILKDRSDRASL